MDAQAQKDTVAHARQEMQVLRAFQERQERHNYQYDSPLNDPESEEESFGADSVVSPIAV